jgi:hypothetical protein
LLHGREIAWEVYSQTVIKRRDETQEKAFPLPSTLTLVP